MASPLLNIKGISDKRQREFNKMGIYTEWDLIRTFPKTYLDLTHIEVLEHFRNHEMILTYGMLSSKPTVSFGKKVKYVRAVCQQGYRVFTIFWYNMPYVADKLEPGEEYLFYGRVKIENNLVTMTNPSFELLDENTRLKGIVPVYAIKGKTISQNSMRSIMKDALERTRIETVIPEHLQKKYALMSLKEAYLEVHEPTEMKKVSKASQRIAIEEYFLLISAFRVVKGDRHKQRTNIYSFTAEDVVEFTKRFGFEFTPGQKNAVNEIFKDMKSSRSMNRLLQGDVGSGKTAVALTAIYMAVKSGYQASMIAPTEILAKQNYNILCRMFPEYEVCFLAGSLKASEKRECKERIKSGEIQIVVGTQAIIQKNVEFKNLSICIVDEQHRFGVEQRSSFEGKGEVPDVLVMSATPIPRTLSLIYYGDLDITVIQGKPEARQPIDTFVVRENKYDDMLGFIRKSVMEGKQAFCVCPKIEEDEEGTVMSVTELYENLKAKLPGLRIALLHGKMKDSEKEEIMSAFKGKEFDILVSTTVVEVGIDVPNATIMVIFNAEFFGLSQLHQLRGRVGRGKDKSYCFLYSQADGDTALERLDIMCKSNDGFQIAEKDSEIRGTGDFFGTRQSGHFINDLGFLSYSPQAIITAKNICDEAFEDPDYMMFIRMRAIEKYDRIANVALN